MSCGCHGIDNSDEARLKEIASTLRFIKGTIIQDDGTTVDLADIFGVDKTPIDRQTAKAQDIYPYIRDKIIFEKGQTCLLTDLLHAIIDEIKDAGLVYTDETRFYVQSITKADWLEMESQFIDDGARVWRLR